VAALALLATVIDLEDTWRTLVAADVRWVALTLFMVPFQILLRTARWHLLLPRRPDGRRPTMLRVMPVLLIGYFGNLVLPARLGEPVRGYLMARRERLSFARVLGSVFLERVIDLATLAFAAVAAAIIAGAPAWMVRGMVIVTLIGIAVAAILVLSGIERAVAVLASVLGGRAARIRLALEQVARFGEGAGGAGRAATLVAAVVISGATWLFVAATYWLLSRSLGMELSMSGSLLVAAVTTLGTAIPSAPPRCSPPSSSAAPPGSSSPRRTGCCPGHSAWSCRCPAPCWLPPSRRSARRFPPRRRTSARSRSPPSSRPPRSACPRDRRWRSRCWRTPSRLCRSPSPAPLRSPG
jgi:glycosyltransferase 2 family protein